MTEKLQRDPEQGYVSLVTFLGLSVFCLLFFCCSSVCIVYCFMREMWFVDYSYLEVVSTECKLKKKKKKKWQRPGNEVRAIAM